MMEQMDWSAAQVFGGFVSTDDNDDNDDGKWWIGMITADLWETFKKGNIDVFIVFPYQAIDRSFDGFLC